MTKKEAREMLQAMMEPELAEAMTGCAGAGDFREWARLAGYPFLEVVDQTSSAGDWTFIVSEDEEEWFLMSQSNRFPGVGFDRSVDRDQPFGGTAEEVISDLETLWA